MLRAIKLAYIYSIPCIMLNFTIALAAFTLFFGSIFILTNGLKCTVQLKSTHPGMNGTDPVEKECQPQTNQCISAKCVFGDDGYVTAMGCKEPPKGSCKDAQLECEKAGGKLEQCTCEPGDMCKKEGDEKKEL